MKNCCEGCENRKIHCHQHCFEYQKQKFVNWFFKEKARLKKENDLLMGVKSIERHIEWRMRRARR